MNRSSVARYIFWSVGNSESHQQKIEKKSRRLEMVPMVLMLLLVFCLQIDSLDTTYTIEDVFIPDNCDSIAKPTDHVLIEYEVLFQNGSTGLSSKKPEQLFHFVVESTVSLVHFRFWNIVSYLHLKEAVPLQKSLKGMCKNSTRKIVWQYAGDINLSPVMRGESALSKLDESVSFQITVNHITTQEDYQIFDALKMNNISKVIDMIDEHKGVNAVDEWGYTPLMLAVSRSNLPVIATLLNTRRPTVDVNLAKPSGFTALFYAVEHAPPTIVQVVKCLSFSNPIAFTAIPE